MISETSDNPIRYEVSGGIAFIRMARPPVNALDLHMVRAVIAAFRQAADDDAVRTVVFASAVAKRFYAGLDIVGLVGKSPEQIRTLVHELCHHLDYELFALEETFHTEGFYKRESSLSNALLATEATMAAP